MRRGIPLVATNEPFFASAEDYEAHDALLCIAEGRLLAETERRHLTAEHRFKTRAEMTALFRRPSRGARLHGRDRRALPRSGRWRASRSCRAFRCRARRARSTRRPSCASAPSDGLRRRIDAHGIAPGFTEEQYRERLAFELSVIERMKYPGYFLIVADFIQWAKSQRIPVGPGRGSGAGSLVAYSLTITDLDPIRFGLIFERFLNPERVSMPDFDIDFCQNRRDEVIRLRAEPLRPRPGRADHHLRQPAGARRAARRRPRARNALRAGRQAVQAGAAEPGRAGDAVARHRGRAAAAGRTRQPADRRARLRDRAEARGPLPPRLDPRGRHRDRRPAARRAGAALSRPQIQHAGHPVQHEMGGAGGPREVRFSRPEDADGAGNRREARRRARHRDRPLAHSARRRQDLRDAGARRDGRHLPGGKPGHAPRPRRHASGPLRGPHRAGRALPAGPDGEHPDLLRPQARPGAHRLPASQAAADPAADLRHHHLPGAGDADRPGPRRLQPRRGRPAAPRHGQEDPQGDGAAARALHVRARWRAASRRPTPRRSSRPAPSSPITASTSRTRRPMRCSPIRPPI